MRSLFRLHLKRIFSSPFYFVLSGFVLICFLLFNGLLITQNIKFINYVARFDIFTYLEVVIFIMLFCEATYFARHKIVLESMCFYTDSQIILSKTLAGVISSLTLCVIPITYAIFSALQEHTDFTFNIIAITYMTMRWVMIISLAQCLGYLTCCFTNTPAIYILSIPSAIIFSFFNVYFLTALFRKNTDKISNYLSVQKPFVNAMEMDYTGARLDFFFFVKFLCVMIFVALVIAIMVAVCRKRRLRSLLLVFLLLFAETLTTCLWSSLYPKEYLEKDKMYVLEHANQPFRIISYVGTTNLTERPKFMLDVQVAQTKQTSANTITFRLDECLSIQELSCNGETVDFSRNGDYLLVELPDNADKNITLHFEYSGRIYYVSSISSINIFSTWMSAALPPNFAFIPLVDGDTSEKNYSLAVSGNNSLISNLDVTALGHYNYKLTGVASSCCIFVGYFDEYTADGITFYTSKYNQISNFEEIYEQSLALRHIDPATFELTDQEYGKPKKVFLIYYLYDVLGYPVVYDDYVMINYGYTSTV